MSKRLPAEWEAQAAVQLTFPHADTDWADTLEQAWDCFKQIAYQVSKRQTLLVACHQIDEVKALLSDLPQENIRYFSVPSNDSWARDHAAITVFEDEKPLLLDFVFNGWGLKFAADLDNQISRRMYEQGAFGKTAMQTTGLVLEGGSIESDGKGTILTTTNCLLSYNRNPQLFQEDIALRIKVLFGAQRVLWLTEGHLAGDDTDAHIDTLARLCDENTIAYVQCQNPEDEHYTSLSAMEQRLKTFRTAQGQPYRLVPLPMADAVFAEDGHRLPATYANFLIINGAVLVPTYNQPHDQVALAALQTCFPDREIVGIDCLALIAQHGSLHCVTMQYPKGVL